MPDRLSARFRRFTVQSALLIGAACTSGGILLLTLDESVFDSTRFGNNVAASLNDPRVAAFAGDRITTAVLDQSPDLTAVRPFILVMAEGVAASNAFRSLVATSARSAHRTFFSEGTKRIVLSVPDVGVLLRSALERASPELAAKIPKRLQAIVTSLGAEGVTTEIVVDLLQLRSRVQGRSWLLLATAFVLLGTAFWLADDLRRGFVGVGVALLLSGTAIASFLPVGSWAVGALVQDSLDAGAMQGLWSVFLAGLAGWGIFLGGLGLLFTAAGTSTLEAFQPIALLQRAASIFVTPPASRRARVLWGLGLIAIGAFAANAPGTMLKTAVVATGLLTGFFGARELFRVVLESVEATPTVARAPANRRYIIRTAATGTSLLLVASLWILWQRPAPTPTPASVSRCNGTKELCARRVDEITFPGAHNAMSNAQIPDWLFPHHRKAIPRQLQDGVRALLIDVHYGFPGGARIKTDLDGERPTRDKLEHAIGAEGLDAALRARETLVGVNEGQRGLYLCHGFCEIGAYELTPTLAQIREFLVRNPGEILLIVVEDYVSAADLAASFEDSGLGELVYQGPSGPPWPTLRELIDSRQQVVVFLESGHPGVDWLRPAFTLMQETPYTFHTPDEFSCRENRGVRDASLFQINHWIETTPAPRPSNAEQVNAHDFLLSRVRLCEKERGLQPNIVAVDFYGIGDLIAVVGEMNRSAANP